MENKIFVGNLPFKLRGAELKDLFSEFGDVEHATVILDRDTKRSKGFGFVEFKEEEAAKKAVAEMNEKEVEGRPLTVNIAKPRE